MWTHVRGPVWPGAPSLKHALPGAVPEEKPQDGYVSAQPAEEPQVVDADRVDHAASYMEMTVPLLHEAMPARTLLTDMSRLARPQVWIPPSQAGPCTMHVSTAVLTGAGWLVHIPSTECRKRAISGPQTVCNDSGQFMLRALQCPDVHIAARDETRSLTEQVPPVCTAC